MHLHCRLLLDAHHRHPLVRHVQLALQLLPLVECGRKGVLRRLGVVRRQLWSDGGAARSAIRDFRRAGSAADGNT